MDRDKTLMLLRKHPDVRVKESSIQTVRNSEKIGIKCWGKIDFLVNHCNFHHIKVDELG